MSLFGELDVESADDNPWIKKDGTYISDLTGLSVKPTKAGDKMGLSLEFKIVEGIYKGRLIKNWLWIPSQEQLKDPDEEKAARAAQAVSQLKYTMTSMGVPADRVNSVQAEDLMAMDQKYEVTIRNKNGSENVTGIAVHEESGSTASPFGG